MPKNSLMTSTAPGTPVRRRPARSYATRAATVATVSAAATLLAVFPPAGAAPTAPATAPAAAPAAVPAVTTGATPGGLAAAAALPSPVAPVVAAPVEPVAAQTVTASPAGATAASAVQHALGKLGAPYRWGGNGPSSFDCSGLVNWAYDQVGVDLPRTSRALSRTGTPVDRANLRPGDLVFFYSPVSHVGIYIGNGQMVHASTSGKPVVVADVDGRPYHSARRVA